MSDAPQRYKFVSVLMVLDMANWQDKDLGNIARKMDNIERRLDLTRGGPKTQKLQMAGCTDDDKLVACIWEGLRDAPQLFLMMVDKKSSSLHSLPSIPTGHPSS